MRTHAFASFASWTAAIGIAAVLTAATAPAVATPLPTSAGALKSAVASDIVQIRSRGRRGAGVAAGIAAGLLLGGLIASSPYYYGGPPAYYGPPLYYPPGYYGPRYGGSRGWIAYCFSRYRSFDPYTGTYMGYDGRRHYCR